MATIGIESRDLAKMLAENDELRTTLRRALDENRRLAMLVDDRPWPLEAERKRTWEAWTEIARLTDLLDGLRLRIRGRGDKYDQSYGGTLLDWAQKMAGTARSVERLVHRIDQDLHPDEIPF